MNLLNDSDPNTYTCKRALTPPCTRIGQSQCEGQGLVPKSLRYLLSPHWWHSVHVFYPMSLLTAVGLRAAESLDWIWEVPYFRVSLNTQAKGECLPLLVKNAQVVFHSLPWSFPDTWSWGWVWIMCQAEKSHFFFPTAEMWQLHQRSPRGVNMP